MPFLKRQPFERQKPPQDLDPEEELFHCKLTDEVFRDYEEFFERVILCNSLVWTCELTGRPGLTYQEALDSEERARKSLAAFPESMKRQILFLSSFTKRGRLADMCDDVSAFVKQRYLKGEEVEVTVNGQKLTCQIVDVIPPDPSLLNGHRDVKEETDASAEQESGTDGSEKKVQVGLDPLLYKYIVKELNSGGKRHTVLPGDVARKKGLFTRDRNKLFLKQHCEPRDTIWRLKLSTISTFNIETFKFSDIFAGPLPSFATTLRKVPTHISPNKDVDVNGVQPLNSKPKPVEKKQVDRTDKGKGERVTKEVTVKKSTKPVPVVTMDDIEQLRKQLEDRRREKEEEKQKQREEKEKERERKREERRVRDEEIRLWLKPRDDLECDDLKDIPPPIPVKCSIPNELFGDVIMVLEFLHTFGPALGLKDFFPQGVTFETLETALTEKDVNSCLCELLQFFMEALFGLQESEEAVQGHARTDSKDISDLCDDDPDLTMAQALQAATAAAAWPQRHQGMPLKQMPLDQYTLTEVLRLHLLSLSGHADYIDYRNSVARGNYTVRDDPALQLRFDDPALLKTLSTRTVYDFSPGEKLQLLQVLMDQLLTFMTVRNQIEETFNNIKTARMELKQMQWAEQRQEREEAAARAKKLLEERLQSLAETNQVMDDNSSGKPEATGDETVVKEEKADQPEEKLEKEVVKQSAEDRKAQQKEAQRKLEFHRKERELLDAISKLQAEGGIQPLGRDRAYRRFWVFNSVPGLFVESDDSFVGSCLPEPTVQNPNSNPYLAHLKEDNNRVNSDKENKLAVNPVATPAVVLNKQHKLLSDNHPIVVVEKLNHAQYLVSTDDKYSANAMYSANAVYSANAKPSVFGMCTASDTCPVHGSGSEQRTRWAFYSNSDELDRVFQSLNPRGIREGALRESLNSERQRLLSSLNRCPVQQLNSDYCWADGEKLSETRKPSRRSVPAKTEKKPSMPVEDEMEVTLREMLLDIEERIYNGSLGNLKVMDRVAWREALHGRTYISSCESLKWGRKQDKCLDADSDSGRGTPMELIEQESSSHRSSSPIPINQVVKDLASALLQIEQSVEPKYLKPPFGSPVEAKKPRTRNSDAEKKKVKKEKGEGGKDVDGDNNSKSKVARTLLERWEESLMSCTSLSQIYVHMSTLERSIIWSRSALNAQCRICRRRGDAEHMLLCDDCDRGHHMYCLKPPLTAIPEGDWYCSDCKPRQPLKGTRAAPKVSSETEEEEEEEEDSDAVEDSEEENEEADSDFDDEEDEEKSSDEDNQNLCKACNKPGTLICCDNCPLSFHLECVNPPLRRVPRGRWDCPQCVKKAKTKKRQGNRSSTQDDEPRAKRPRRSDRNISAAESEDEIWLFGRRKQGPAVRRGASRDVPVDYKLCDQILLELTRHDCSWPFLRPVGRKQVPQYYEVISRPVDLASMRGKLSDMEYRTTKDFILDVMLMLQNCIMYNSVDSAEYKAADRLSKFFETYFQQLGFSSIEDFVNSGCCSSTPSSPDLLASKQAGRYSRRT